MDRALRLLVGLMLVIAACGGGSEEPETTSTAAPGAGTAAATTAPPTASTAAPAANPSDDFCEFIIAYADEADFSPVGLGPDEIEELFTNNLDAINQAADLAPSEIRDDVQMFAQAYGGFVDLLAENGFNFLAMANVDLDDPRMTALEDPALEAAGDRIEAYCGIENFIASAPTTPDVPGAGGGGGGTLGGDLPDGFPTELVPEGAEIVVVLNVQGVDSVTYDIALATDDVIAFYEDLLGAATAEIPSPKGALWIATYEGLGVTVTVAETDPTTTQVNISLG